MGNYEQRVLFVIYWLQLIRMDLGLRSEVMITRWGWMTIFHYFTRQTTDDNPWLSSKNGKRLEICCFESNGADKLKRTFWGSENDKNRLMVVIADDNGVTLSETGTKHALCSVRDTHTLDRTWAALNLTCKVNSCTEIVYAPSVLCRELILVEFWVCHRHSRARDIQSLTKDRAPPEQRCLIYYT